MIRTTQPASGASRRARRSRLAVVSTIAVACTVVLALAGRYPAQAMLRGSGTSAGPVAFGPQQAGQGPAGSPSGRFRISGAVSGLYPGATAQLVLTVTNPGQFAIEVTSIQTAVTASPSAGCHASYLTVATFSGQLAVTADGSAQLSVPITLSHAAPNACQGVVFPLAYSGLARRA